MLEVQNKDGETLQYKDIYAVNPFMWFLDTLAFKKSKYKTKEEAVNAFNEIMPGNDIDSITESYVRFCWWTEDHSSYEYPGEDVRQCCGYRTTEFTGRGSFDCWIIHIDLHWERMCENA